MTSNCFLLTANDLHKHTTVLSEHDVHKQNLLFSMFEQKMRQGAGIIYLDTNPQLGDFGRFHKMAIALNRNQDVRLIDLENAVESHTYNPLMQGSADAVARRVMSLLSRMEATDEQRALIFHGLKCILSAIFHQNMSVHFLDLERLTSSASALEMLRLNTPKDDGATRDFHVWVAELMLVDDVSGAESVDQQALDALFMQTALYLKNFAHGDAGKVLCTYNPEVSLEESLRENQLVYIALPAAVEDETLRAFAHILFSDLCLSVKTLHEKGIKTAPGCLCVMDDVHTYFSKSFLPLMDFAREINMSLVGVVSEEMTEDKPFKYTEALLSFMENCEQQLCVCQDKVTHLFMGLEYLLPKGFVPQSYEVAKGEGVCVTAEKLVKFSIRPSSVGVTEKHIPLMHFNKIGKKGLDIALKYTTFREGTGANTLENTPDSPHKSEESIKEPSAL